MERTRTKQVKAVFKKNSLWFWREKEVSAIGDHHLKDSFIEFINTVSDYIRKKERKKERKRKKESQKRKTLTWE